MNRTSQNSEIAPLLQQLEDLSQSFEDFHLSFISRNCNKIAHECARMVSQHNRVVEYLITPPGLRDIVFADCNLIIINGPVRFVEILVYVDAYAEMCERKTLFVAEVVL